MNNFEIYPVILRMNETELSQVIESILAKKQGSTRINRHDQLKLIQRKKFPATYLPIIEPLLHHKSFYKHAIDIVGNMKGAATDASDAVEAAWEKSWTHDVPQACNESFRALLKIGNNDQRLLGMIEKAMEIDNYQIHKCCAETLMKIDGGKEVLKAWHTTTPGKCDCNLHRKLTEKVDEHVRSIG